MSDILVSGLINIETTLRVDSFPLTYDPVRYPFFGVNSTVSGVGYNIAKALATLGDSPRLLSLTGRDLAGDIIQGELAHQGVGAGYVIQDMPHTCQSVIIYDGGGRRQIHTDLKDIQDRAYPVVAFEQALAGCSLAALCNINFSRPFLARVRAAGIPIATDVHTIANLEDDYNSDFMAAADILFMSDEALPVRSEEWARAVQARYGPAIIVIGLGPAGALLAVKDDGYMGCLPAVATRPVVNTIGAGDALFSSFLHVFRRTGDPYLAVRKALVFASYKIGETGAAEGFLSVPALDKWYGRVGTIME